jgi:hypothetical protein
MRIDVPDKVSDYFWLFVLIIVMICAGAECFM